MNKDNIHLIAKEIANKAINAFNRVSEIGKLLRGKNLSEQQTENLKTEIVVLKNSEDYLTAVGMLTKQG